MARVLRTDVPKRTIDRPQHLPQSPKRLPVPGTTAYAILLTLCPKSGVNHHGDGYSASRPTSNPTPRYRSRHLSAVHEGDGSRGPDLPEWYCYPRCVVGCGSWWKGCALTALPERMLSGCGCLVETMVIVEFEYGGGGAYPLESETSQRKRVRVPDTKIHEKGGENETNSLA